MACVCSRYNASSSWLNLRNHSPVITGLQTQSRKPCNKQLISLEQSVLRENLKPRPCCIDHAIAWSIRPGLGLRFYSKDLTFG